MAIQGEGPAPRGSPTGRPDAGRVQSERFRNGMAFRRLIHGHEHVDEAWAEAGGNAQRAALEEFITECVWGMIWSRGVISTKVRSLLTIALLIATHQPRDLMLHMRSAVMRNDCTLEELREVVLHTAPYCGVPAAVDALALTNVLARELEQQRSSPAYAVERRNGHGKGGK